MRVLIILLSFFIIHNISVEAGVKKSNHKLRTKVKRKVRVKRNVSSKPLTLEDVSKSTALIVSSTGQSVSFGSGFFIASSLLVTNYHVIEKVKRINNSKIVIISTPQKVQDVGFVLVEDKEHDLAIIKTVKKVHKPLMFGTYSRVKLGDDIFVLGSPEGLIGTLSKGIVSAKRKEEDINFLQITAPISQGSSGSPVLNKDLKVIGIVVKMLKEGQNINFAIPVSYLKKLIRKHRKDLVQVNKINVEEILKNQLSNIAKLKQSALQGNANAQYNLGLMYYNGQGTPQSYKQAIYWIKKAALQGNANAQSDLGVMYNKGQGVPQSHKQALYWYKKAAKQDYAVAQSDLGVMYDNGQGVPQSHKQALYWYKKSALQGNANAQYNLGVMYNKGQGVPQSHKQALYWYKKSALQGNANAQYNLGSMYYSGQGVPQSYKQALYWYKKAAKQDYAVAQYNLGVMHVKGQGTPQSYKQALYWYKKAAKQDYAVAQYNLGVMYYNGQGTPQDYKKAYAWVDISSISSSGDLNEGHRRSRDLIASKMSPKQLAEARELSAKMFNEISKRKLASKK